jgi:hypothetical protein
MSHACLLVVTDDFPGNRKLKWKSPARGTRSGLASGGSSASEVWGLARAKVDVNRGLVAAPPEK